MEIPHLEVRPSIYTPGVGQPTPFHTLCTVIAITPAFALLDIVCQRQGFGGAHWSCSSPLLTTTAAVASQPNLTLVFRFLHTPSRKGLSLLQQVRRCSLTPVPALPPSLTFCQPPVCPRDQVSPSWVPSAES